MTRITTALATVLSLGFTPVAAQETNCDGWMSSSWEVQVQFWETATVDTVSDCLNSGANVNARDIVGQTPLHNAARSNVNPEVLTVLLEAGADVNARDMLEQTPLHLVFGYLVSGNENPQVITTLLDAGADVNARDSGGGTPLHGAVWFKDRPEVLTVLLEAGANINSRDIDGEMPLHVAARTPHIENITLLLEAGADGTAVDADGKTPFDIAKGNEALVGTDAYWALSDARFE